jgi:hypothetical protein
MFSWPARERPKRPNQENAISVPIRNFYVICFQRVDRLGLWFCVPIRIFGRFDHVSHRFSLSWRLNVTKRYHFVCAILLPLHRFPSAENYGTEFS